VGVYEFGLKMKQILALSDLAKGFLILVSIIPFYIFYILWAWFVVEFDPAPGTIYLDRLESMIQQYVCILAVTITLLLLGLLVKYFARALEKYFLLAANIITVAFLLYSGHLVGALSISTGIVMMSAGILGLILLDFKVVLSIFVASIIAVFASSFAASLGYIEYSPVFVGSPTGGEHPSMFWVLSTMSFSLPFVVVFFIISTLLIRQWKAYDQEILKMASIDPLTQLNNRRVLMDSFKRELALYDRKAEEHALSCMMFDLDFFKKVNDNYGHQVGDEVLVKTASVLMSCIREYDIAGRYGGEEFLVVLPRTGGRTAEIVAERCREKIEALDFTLSDGKTLKVTASFGVASAAAEASMAEMIHAADEALYRAKENGRNCVVMADDADMPLPA
jgi:diguanylate cyclase (GGDEF)-like protein